jgi:predicted ATPase
MLTRLKLENFKSWRELDIELAPITLLFGTNSSGKSNILQSILLLEQTATNIDYVGEGINFGGAGDYVDLGSYRSMIFNHDDALKVGFGIEWQSASWTDSAFIRWKFVDDVVTFDECHSDNHKPGHPGKPRDENTKLVKKDCKHILDELRETFVNRELEISYLGPLRQHPERSYLWTGTTPQRIGSRGENTIAALIASVRGHSENPDLLTQVADWLTKSGLAIEFKIDAIDGDKRFYETLIRISKGNSGNSLVDVGFGISQILPVLTMLFFVPEGSIVLLEQPELHLHPRAQAHLADLFLHVAEERNLQLIVESHSEHLLRRLQRRIAETDYAFATPDNIKAYFCEPGSDGSTSRPVEVDAYGQIRNWPDSFFGDLANELDKMMEAAIDRRRRELSAGD